MSKLFVWTCLAALALSACNPGPSNNDSGATACNQIVETCHPVDPGTGRIHECHEYAEATGRTEAECQGMLASCLSTCRSADAGRD